MVEDVGLNDMGLSFETCRFAREGRSFSTA